MANKVYLDAEGVKRLKKYIDDQISSLQKAIDLLNNTDGTPGSIQQMIDDAINEISNVSGGSAPEGGEEP